jgi:hypothetical protein
MLGGGMYIECEATTAEYALRIERPAIVDALHRIAEGQFDSAVPSDEQVAAIRKIAADALASADVPLRYFWMSMDDLYRQRAADEGPHGRNQ